MLGYSDLLSKPSDTVIHDEKNWDKKLGIK